MKTQILSDQNQSPEMIFLGSLRNQLEDAVADYAGDPSIMQFVQNANYVSVMVQSSLAFSLRLQGKRPYISLPAANENLIPEGTPSRRATSPTNHVQVLLNSAEDAYNYVNLMINAINATIARYPADWSCCSRYMECSDAKKCVHPDRKFALSCGYQKILQSGRIFYGKNRNID